MRPNDRLEKIVATAFGETGAMSPNELTAAERVRVEQLSKIANTFQVRIFEAPKDAIDAAKAFMPIRERVEWLAVLKRTTLGLAGARFEAADQFQAVFEAEGRTIRVSCERERFGWRILGQIDEQGWIARCGAQSLEPSTDGRFEFEAERLEDLRIVLIRDDAMIIVPSIIEANRDTDR